MSQQLWRHDEQTRDAVLQHKCENRYVAEQEQDLLDFRDIFWAPIDGGQRSWAQMMIKSIEHELDEIRAGRLTVQEVLEGTEY